MYEKKKGGYQSIHQWLKRHYGKAFVCDNRGKQILDFECSGKSERFHYALKKHFKHGHNRENYFMLCVSCHRRYDMTKDKTKKRIKTMLKNRVILQYSDNKIIKTWESILEPSDELGISRQAIWNCLNNRSRTAGGFYWKYLTI